MVVRLETSIYVAELKPKLTHALVFGAIFAIAACHFGPRKAPTGQVVATVGDREITSRELHADLAGAPPAAVAVQRTRERAVLQSIIQRAVLADAAKKRGLDKDPTFILQQQRAIDALLVQQLQVKIADAVPASSAEEANHFIDTNTNLFSERKIFTVDQIRMPRPTDETLLTKLKPLKSLDEVSLLLTDSKVPFQRGVSEIDAVRQSPKLIDAIMTLPPQEVFIIASGNQLLVNVIRETRTQPFVGEAASKYASSYLHAQHVQEAIKREFSAVLSKAKGDIQINASYVDPPTKPPAQR